jgi:hypothetical protein
MEHSCFASTERSIGNNWNAKPCSAPRKRFRGDLATRGTNDLVFGRGSARFVMGTFISPAGSLGRALGRAKGPCLVTQNSYTFTGIIYYEAAKLVCLTAFLLARVLSASCRLPWRKQRQLGRWPDRAPAPCHSSSESRAGTCMGRTHSDTPHPSQRWPERRRSGWRSRDPA